MHLTEVLQENKIMFIVQILLRANNIRHIFLDWQSKNRFHPICLKIEVHLFFQLDQPSTNSIPQLIEYDRYQLPLYSIFGSPQCAPPLNPFV